ncbi:MAG: hypothetical protein OEX97_04900, partial [Acidimicrobiia bacterium]|nr:hypothetical protein [Acidimicrobiia bacterium]
APSEKGQPVDKAGGLNKRLLVGGGILVAALAVIIISVQNSSEPEPPAATGQMPGTATGSDPCAELADTLSNHPDDGFRLALADCYSQSGNAMSAIEHYKAVADNAEGAPADVADANVGLGYLNLQISELNNAAEYMEAALEADPSNLEGQYWLGLMLIYDLGDSARGVSLLEAVLETPDLPPDTIQSIEEAIAEGQAGGAGS